MKSDTVSAPLSWDDLERVCEQEEFDYLIPYGNQREIVMVLAGRGDTVEGWYTDGGSWTLEETKTLVSPRLHYGEAVDEGEVIFQGIDAETIDQLHRRTGEQANQAQSADIIQFLGDMDGSVTGDWATCSHSTTAWARIGNGGRLSYCQDCGRPDVVDTGEGGLHVDGYFQKLARANRHVKRQSLGSATLLQFDEAAEPAAHLAVMVLCTLSELETVYSVSYEAGGYQVLVYVQDDAPKGVLLWNSREGVPILRQVYVRPDARREGVAARLVKEWESRYCEQPYLAETPNTHGRALLDAVGHLPESSTEGSHAKLAHSLCPTQF